MVDEVEDVVLTFEEVPDVNGGGGEGGGLEEGGRHCLEGWVARKACWLKLRVLDSCLRGYCNFFLFLYS